MLYIIKRIEYDEMKIDILSDFLYNLASSRDLTAEN